MIKQGEKYLITTDHWFVGEDGQYYRSVYGTCHIKTTEEIFNFTPKEPSTNWFIVVGNEEKNIIIAGCQIHYAIKTKNKPDNFNAFKTYKDKDTGLETKAEKIYFIE